MAEKLTWTTEQRRLGDLLDWQRNPRQISIHDKAALRDSLTRFGLAEPLIVNVDGGLVGGHQRKRIMLEAGMSGPDDLVDVRVPSRALTDDERAELAIRLNRNRGEWDFDALKAEFPVAELLNYGFEALELEFEEVDFEDPAATGPPAREDEAEALAEKWGTAPGQVWVAGRHRLVCGDATDPAVAAAAFGGRLPLLCVTDPPYGVGYEPAWREVLNEADRRLGEVENDERADWAAAFRLFGGDVVYCWHAAHFTCTTQAMLEEAGFAVRAEIVWAKPHFVIGRGHYHWKHELCWYAVRSGATAHWVGDRSQTTVWTVPLDEAVEGGHGTQKPLECMARPIRNHEGDVYDPFVGSGTTLIAAEALGRACYAVDISPAYVAVSLQRLEDAGMAPELADSI